MDLTFPLKLVHSNFTHVIKVSRDTLDVGKHAIKQ